MNEERFTFLVNKFGWSSALALAGCLDATPLDVTPTVVKVEVYVFTAEDDAKDPEIARILELCAQYRAL